MFININKKTICVTGYSLKQYSGFIRQFRQTVQPVNQGINYVSYCLRWEKMHGYLLLHPYLHCRKVIKSPFETINRLTETRRCV